MRKESISSRTDNIRNVRFAPERSQELTRQRRILRSTEAIIEVPKDMYSRGKMEFE